MMSARLRASVRSEKRVKIVFASAGGAGSESDSTWNAMPPTRIDITDSVRTWIPLESSETSMPLAFQKRVSFVTYWS